MTFVELVLLFLALWTTWEVVFNFMALLNGLERVYNTQWACVPCAFWSLFVFSVSQ